MHDYRLVKKKMFITTIIILLIGGAATLNFTVAVGNGFTCVSAMGQAKCWGVAGPNVDHGQIGDGTTSGIGAKPGQLSGHAPVFFRPQLGVVVAVTTGYAHSCALISTGRIVCFGDGGFAFGSVGAIGIDSSDSAGGCPVSGVGCLAISSLPGVSFGIPEPFVVGVSAGGGSSCAIFADGRAKCFGRASLGLTAPRTLGRIQGPWPL